MGVSMLLLQGGSWLPPITSREIALFYTSCPKQPNSSTIFIVLLAAYAASDANSLQCLSGWTHLPRS